MSIPTAFGLTAAAILAFTVYNLLRFRALRRVGVRTEGLVVDALENLQLEGENLVVAFVDNQGVPRQVMTQAGSVGWRRKLGQKMSVTYDPRDPTRARIHEDVRLQTWVGIGLIVIFGGISVAMYLR